MVKIIVEGSDDKKFITKFLLHLSKKDVITLNTSRLNNYFEIMAGKSSLLNISNYDKLTKQIQATKVNKVLFIFDADFKKDDKECGGLVNSKSCIDDLIKNLNWNIPTDYYIFDKNLDYFLIDTINKTNCLVELEKCLDLKEINPNRKTISTLYRNYYPIEPYNFENKKFNNLANKLKTLFN